ncbi:ABC transporter permease subunit [Paenibacillus sp. LHD-117]|uniref:ABC transporter permease n=1 Tax=Paenibacillus sp. LHD-117 TaxID=3071412 RepID=UPI0027DFB58E|nr:ABC transporter permease subunit [Paenibacillus sp. LHD-117]MDQ6420550.1 ABC transporter permease subunit [Paenibacillus sp. LHD-117]
MNLQSQTLKNKESFLRRCVKQRYLIMMVLPGLLLILVFKYIPMYGVTIAFKSYDASLGFLRSPWIGIQHFQAFFDSPMSWRIIKNSLLLAFYSLLFGFPAPIIFALLLNELRQKFFKRVVQTITYFPHFLSAVIVIGFVHEFSSVDGIINKVMGWFGAEPKALLYLSEAFRPLYIGSGIWQELGYGAIIYLAALTGIDPAQYEAAVIDGANRWQRLKYVTWPAIIPATSVMLILKLGSILSTDFQKVLLMYNPKIYDTADVIETYVYRVGVQGGQFEYGAAVGLMLSVISFVLIVLANSFSKRVSENSLW